MVTVSHGRGPKRGKITARIGLAEQLTPHMRTIQNPRQPAALLFFGAAREDRRASPTQTDFAMRHVDTCALKGGIDLE